METLRFIGKATSPSFNEQVLILVPYSFKFKTKKNLQDKILANEK